MKRTSGWAVVAGVRGIIQLHTTLAELVLKAPGRGAARNGLEVLRQLASAGDQDAVDALRQLLADELGQDPHSPLLELYVQAFQPFRMLDNLADLVALTRQVDDDLRPFQRLVRRQAPTAEQVLVAYLLCAFTTTFGSDMLRESVPKVKQLMVLREILGQARIVPGEAADHSFQFGRDFLLDRADAASLLGVIYHELGHHVVESGLAGGAAVTATPQLLDEFGQVLPDLLDAAANARGPMQGTTDPRFRRLQDGPDLICSVEHLPLGDYVHLSINDARGLDLEDAVAVAHRALRLLGTDVADTAAAVSPRGVFHFGFKGTPSSSVRERAAQVAGGGEVEAAMSWFNILVASNKVAKSEMDFPHLLGVVGEPTYLHGEDPDAAESEQQLCDAIEGGADLETSQEALLVRLLQLTVRCARPDAVAKVLEEGRRTGRLRDVDAGLQGLGFSGYVIREGPQVDYQGPDLPSLWATIERLKAAGLDIDGVVTDDGQTLLTDAAARSSELVSGLLAAGAKVDQPNSEQETPLVVATWGGSVETVRMLLDAGADVTRRDASGLAAVHYAAWVGGAALGLLIDSGAKTTERTNDGRTPLMVARSVEVVSQLVAAGVDVGSRDNSGMTALMHAASRGDLDVVKALMDLRADPNAATDLGWTALHLAAQTPEWVGSGEVIAALLDAGAEVDEETDDGVTALMCATAIGAPQNVTLLIERNADVDVADRHGTTALLLASDGRRIPPRGELDFGSRVEQCIRILGEAGADLNHTNELGESALILATMGFDASPVELLLELGADPNVRALNGATALQNAEAQGHNYMIELLQAATATGRAHE